MKDTPECQKLRECKDCDDEKKFEPSSDGCSFVPDNPLGFDFKSSCDLHDRLYRTCYDLEDEEEARHWADRRLRNKLQSECTPGPGSSLGNVLFTGPSCIGLSIIYTQVVEVFNEPNFSDVERYRSTIRRAAIDEFGNPGELQRVCNEFYPEDSTSQRTCRKIAEGRSVDELSPEESRRASFMFRALEDFRRVANFTFFEQNQACCRQGDLQCLN